MNIGGHTSCQMVFSNQWQMDTISIIICGVCLKYRGWPTLARTYLFIYVFSVLHSGVEWLWQTCTIWLFTEKVSNCFSMSIIPCHWVSYTNMLLGTAGCSGELIGDIFDFTMSLLHTLSPSVNPLGSISRMCPRPPTLSSPWTSAGSDPWLLLTLRSWLSHTSQSWLFQ